MKQYNIYIFCVVLFWLQSCGFGTPSTNNNSTTNGGNSTTTSENGNNNNQPTNDQFVLDGLLQYASENELRNAFGANNIGQGIRYAPEGLDSFKVSLLYPNTPDEVAISWNNEGNRTGVAFVEVDRVGTRWKTANGITVGTSLAALHQLNGKSFKFNGFGWDYGGFVNWGENSPLVQKGYYVRLDMITPEGELPTEEFERLLGDSEHDSDDPLARRANIQVTMAGVHRD